jgi:hypothetical protein
MAEQITDPIIFFYEKQDHPGLFGYTDVALMFIGGDPDWKDGTVEIFDAEGRRLRYRYAASRREKWWSILRTDFSDFEIVGKEAAELRARLTAALASASGSAPRSDAPLSELVDDAFARWMVD